MLILKIAFRNVLRHKGKSIVIGLILFLGGLVTIIGSGTISGMERNVSHTLVDSSLGDITVMSSKQAKEDVMNQFMGATIDVLPYDLVGKALEENEMVADHLPYTIGFLMLLTSSHNSMGYPPNCAVFGTDMRRYYDFFSNMSVVEGRLPEQGEKGILLSSFMREMYYQFNQDLYYPKDTAFKTNYLPTELQGADPEALDIKNDIILMGISDKNSTSDVKIPIRGVLKYKVLELFWREISIMDVDSFRQAMNYTIGAQEPVEVSSADAKLLALDGDDLDSLFSSGSLVEATATGGNFNINKYFVGINDENNQAVTDKGIFHVIAVKIKKPYRNDLDKVIKNLNQDFADRGLAAKAVHWKIAGGGTVQFIDYTRIALYAAVFLVFLAAIIVIMNTLAMTTLERSEEFGMMRAIGTQRGFISRMLLGETFVLSFFFGGLGILAGMAILFQMAQAKIAVTNEFAQVITGGDIYSPVLTGTDILMAFVYLGLVTVLSVIYPVFVSRKITPLDAIARN